MKKWAAYALVTLLVSAVPLAVVALNAYAVHEWWRAHDLSRHGVAHEAIVLTKNAARYTRSDSFSVELGQLPVMSTGPESGDDPGVMTIEVDESTYYSLVEGGRATLLVDPSTPMRFDVRGNMIHWKYVLYAAIADAISGVALIALWRWRRRQLAAA
jgi:hypothetical protein